jgi:hypothetical protein
MSYRHKADSCCDFNDFTTLLKSLVDVVIPGCNFVEAYPGDKDGLENLKTPIITYKILERVPYKEIKPTFRERMDDIDDPNKVVTIYGQRFIYLVQFMIWGQSNNEANIILDQFESMIATYTGDLMNAGVQQIIFDTQGTDNRDTTRPNLASRTLTYKVILERHLVVIEPKIKLIVGRVNGDLVFNIEN